MPVLIFVYKNVSSRHIKKAATLTGNRHQKKPKKPKILTLNYYDEKLYYGLIASSP